MVQKPEYGLTDAHMRFNTADDEGFYAKRVKLRLKMGIVSRREFHLLGDFQEFEKFPDRLHGVSEGRRVLFSD